MIPIIVAHGFPTMVGVLSADMATQFNILPNIIKVNIVIFNNKRKSESNIPAPGSIISFLEGRELSLLVPIKMESFLANTKLA